MPHPANPQKLPGTKWTALFPEAPRRHWEVVQVHKTSGEAELRAVLDGTRMQLAWRELRDRARWVPDWQP